MRRLMKYLAIAVLAPSTIAVFAEEKATIQAYSVSVRKGLSKEDAKIYFAERGGVRIQTVIGLPGKMMLAIDEKASKLGSFKDDVGTDLTKAVDAPRFGSSWVESFTFKASEKGDRALLTFNAEGVPAASAKKILLNGTIAIVCGGGEKSIELKNVELKGDPKAKQKIGDYTFTVENSAFGGDKQIRFESNNPSIRSVAFTTAAGETIKTDKPSNSRFGFNNKYTYHTDYRLNTKAEKINITVTYFEKIETTDVPVELSVGIGLE